MHPEDLSEDPQNLAVQVSSIDSLEKQKLTIEKFFQANVHGSAATPMDVDALAKTKGGKKGGKGKDKGVKEVRRQLFLVWRVWSHDGGLAKEGSWETASSQVSARTGSETEGQRQRWQRQEGASSRTVRNPSVLLRKPTRRLQVSLLVLSVDTRGTVNWTGKPGEEFRNRQEVSGHPTRVEIVSMLSTLSWERESI